MKPSNGFNKKQKEEIREIVKSEIREALRKNAKPDVNVKNEVIEAIYSILNEKNDDLIENLLEIETKISKAETDKSFFAYNIKQILYALCWIAWFCLAIFIGIAIYLCFTNSDIQQNIFSIIMLLLTLGFSTIILFIFHKSIKNMNKSDSYNAFMFIITIIAFAFTIYSTLK